MNAVAPVIEVRGLRKRDGRVDALRGLDLAVPAGSIYGLLGRNGAGKTTTLKTLIGMIQPGGGDVRIFGHHPRDARGGVEIRRRFAHVGEYRSNGADHFSRGPGQAWRSVPALAAPLWWRRSPLSSAGTIDAVAEATT